MVLFADSKVVILCQTSCLISKINFAIFITQIINMYIRRNIPGPMSISFLYAFLSSEKMNCVEDPQNGLGGIYVGSLESANDTELLRKNGVKAVLTVASGTGLSYSKQAGIIEHLILPAEDIQSFDISKHFDTGTNFIQRNRKLGNVLVHCHAGISRSSTIVLAYLMKTKGWKLEKALNEVRKRRQIISPNPGFLRHLLNFQKKIQPRINNENRIVNPLAITKSLTKPTQSNTLTPSNVKISQSVAKKNDFIGNKQTQLKPLNLKGNNYFEKKKDIIAKEAFSINLNKQAKQQRKSRPSFNLKHSQVKNKSHAKSASMSKVNFHYSREKEDLKFKNPTTEQKGILFGKMLNSYKGPQFSGSQIRGLF